jgi:hypothetical protein
VESAGRFESALGGAADGAAVALSSASVLTRELRKAKAAGMRHIEHDMLLLEPPDDDELDRAYVALKKLHGGAFGWSPPDVAGLERLGATRMRQYVRSWINEWDLVRLDPSFLPQTEVISIATDYREDTALESTAEPVPGDLGYQDRADGAAAGSEEEIH